MYRIKKYTKYEKIEKTTIPIELLTNIKLIIYIIKNVIIHEINNLLVSEV